MAAMSPLHCSARKRVPLHLQTRVRIHNFKMGDWKVCSNYWGGQPLWPLEVSWTLYLYEKQSQFCPGCVKLDQHHTQLTASCWLHWLLTSNVCTLRQYAEQCEAAGERFSKSNSEAIALNPKEKRTLSESLESYSLMWSSLSLIGSCLVCSVHYSKEEAVT